MNNLSVQFLEQPASMGYRFVSEDNNNINESLRGVNGTFPSLQIDGPGRLKLVIQLVSNNEPFRPHPFALIGKHCKNGIYFNHIQMYDTTQVLKLDQIGIQFFTPDENEKALEFRKNNNMDPFGTGFSTEYLNFMEYFRVRLCVTVKVESENGEITKTIISDTIYDKMPIDIPYYKMRTGMTTQIDVMLSRITLVIEMLESKRREVNVRSDETTHPIPLAYRINNVSAAMGMTRIPFEGTTPRNELFDRNQRRSYNRRRNRVSPFAMRINIDQSNFIQPFPNSSLVFDTLLYPITEIESINLVSGFNLLQINDQPNEPPIGPQSNISNMFNSMNLN